MAFDLPIILALSLLIGYSMLITLLWLRSRPWRSKRTTQRIIAEAEALDEREKQRRILESADEAQRLSQTFQKFVPRQFVDHFAKHGSANLELGRADEDEMAIMFCDIRGFTRLSEQMKPQELMNFLNSYFLRMNEPIHQNGGFIDKFIGDAIMALFDHPGGSAKDKAKDAFQAAMDLHKALGVYNYHRRNSWYAPISISIGMHFGPVIIGTVGSDDRMDTTVLGDAVNVASRLEALSPTYNADIIVSSQMLETLGANYPVKTRLLDWVRVRGRQKPLEIYEILSHMPEEQQRYKQSIQTDIAAGIACRVAQDWDGAMVHFMKARERCPDDKLAEHHIRVIQQYQYQVLDEDWDGSLPV